MDKEQAVRDAFLRVIGNIIDDTILQDIVRALEAGNIEAVFRALGVQESVWEPLIDAIEDAYKAAGYAFAATFPARLQGPDGAFVFRFSMRNPFVEKWLKEQSSRLIVAVTEETREAVREIARAGAERGSNPRSVALDIVGRVDPATKQRIGGVVGLTVRQAQWVESARARLMSLDPAYLSMQMRDKRFDKLVERAIRTGKPLTAADVDRLIVRYRDNALKFRAEMIARTEMLQGQSAAEYEATRQVVAMGAARESAVQRVWDSAGDARTRPSHRAMEGQTVGFDEPFVTPGGARLMYPGDQSLGAPGKEVILCRCRARPKINWVA
jgi:hypothetical protein